MPQSHITQYEYSEKLRHLSYVTIATVSFLIIIKLIAYSYTGSIILLSVAADSVFDLIISLTNFILVRISLKKSTSAYRYGYGKAEALSAFIEGMIILIISLSVLAIAIQEYFNPESQMPHANLALSVMVISLATTFFLVRYQSMVMHHTDSISV